MSYKTNYIVPDMQNAQHEDKIAQILRTALMVKCNWLQYCLCMIHKMPITGLDSSDKKTTKDYPIYYPVLQSKDYRVITPDNECQAIGFFTLNSDPEYLLNDEGVKYDMSFICWYNQQAITNVIYEDITNGLINEVIKVLKYNACDGIKKTVDFSNIFDYSGIDLKTVSMLGNNFKAFKITFNYYQSECYEEFSQMSFT